jgi:hypothetical protein
VKKIFGARSAFDRSKAVFFQEVFFRGAATAALAAPDQKALGCAGMQLFRFSEVLYRRYAMLALRRAQSASLPPRSKQAKSTII